MVGRSVKNANEINVERYSAEVQQTFMSTFVLFIVVIQCHFPHFADGLGYSVQTWGLLQVRLNIVVQRLLKM